MEESEIDAIGREMLRRLMQGAKAEQIDATGREMLRQFTMARQDQATLMQGPYNLPTTEVVPSRFMAEKLAEQAELRKVKKDFEEVLGHLRKLVYENGSRKIDMRAEVINILAEYE